jgi:uncharacterized protein
MNADALDTLLAPPEEAAVRRAINDFAKSLRTIYGDRLRGVYLFGSRARGDHRPESDADIAVILADGPWNHWTERMRLADLEYDTIIATGVEPQAWPVRESEWRDETKHRNPALVRAMRQDARPIEMAA